MQKLQNSSFWFDDTDNIDVLTGEKIQLGKDYIKLAATKRAIANFVQIVTGENFNLVHFGTREKLPIHHSVSIVWHITCC